MMSIPTYEFAELNGTTIHYQDSGNGNAIVLLHSGVSDLRFWDDQMAAFSANHRVVRFDQRGSGLTPYPATPFSYYDDVHAMLDYLGIEKAAIIGCSFSGGTALNFALRYPERIAALVVVCGAVGGFEYEDSADDKAFKKAFNTKLGAAWDAGDLPACAELLTQYWFDGRGRAPDESDPAIRQRAYDMLLHLMALPEEAGTEVGLEPPAFGRLHTINTPTLAILGTLDEESVNAAMRAVAERVPGAQLAVFEGTAHYPNMEQSAEFNQLVLNFLSSSL
ncbi:MAG: alpha/beta hydrolase [Anaerolineae bacterium]|nr:alpha/beta hydrolase [Anaerolineae bacterium]